MSDVLQQIVAQMRSGGQQANPTLAAVDRAAPQVPPPDPQRGYTDLFNTPLTPEQEAAYQAWGKQQAATRPDHRNPALDTYDYDMRGAWLSNAQAAANGHLPDTWKKPNEPTFSTQSKYSTPQMPGGAWGQQSDGTWTFTPSPFNLKMNSPEDLQRTWHRDQPGSRLILPMASPASPIQKVAATPGAMVPAVPNQVPVAPVPSASGASVQGYGTADGPPLDPGKYASDRWVGQDMPSRTSDAVGWENLTPAQQQEYFRAREAGTSAQENMNEAAGIRPSYGARFQPPDKATNYPAW